MTRQARKLSRLEIYQDVWYRHASTVTAGGPLFWSNTIVVAYEKMIRSARACSLCHAKNRPHDQIGVTRTSSPSTTARVTPSAATLSSRWTPCAPTPRNTARTMTRNCTVSLFTAFFTSAALMTKGLASAKKWKQRRTVPWPSADLFSLPKKVKLFL